MKEIDDDPILISTDKNTIRRILIDDESVVKILSYDVYQKLGLRDNDLKSTKPIYIFGKNFINIRRRNTLSATVWARKSYHDVLRQLYCG